jgi:hypothetical protein
MKRFLPLVLLLVSCADTPIDVPVRLDRAGMAVDTIIKPKRDHYTIGFRFETPFPMTGNPTPRVFATLHPLVEITIADRENRVVAHERSRISAEESWIITYGMSTYGGEAYKFLDKWTPRSDAEYHLTVRVIDPAPAAQPWKPRFRMNYPTASF